MKKIILFLTFINVCSCKSEYDYSISDPYKSYIENDFDTYSDIYNQINDTINKWIVDSLSLSLGYFDKSYQIDSAIVFNTRKDLLYTTINNSSKLFHNSKMDMISEIQGVKIKNNWHFYFTNNHLAVPRELYTENIYDPFSYEELSYIAHDELYRGLIFNIKDGSYKPNDTWFDEKFYSKEIESKETLTKMFFLKNRNERNNKIDPIELESRKNRMLKSKRPTNPKRELSFTEKLFGKKKKLFDSDVWKNRHKE